MTPSPQTRWLYAGVALFLLLAAFTFHSVVQEQERRAGESRAQALFELVEDKAPNRPTETPGVVAWLQLELKKYGRRIEDPVKARLYGEVAAAAADGAVPPFLAGLAERLARPPQAGGELARPLPAAVPAPPPLRSLEVWDLAGSRFVVTRRQTLAAAGPAADPFLIGSIRHLESLRRNLEPLLAQRPLPAVPGREPVRVVRLYAVGEDGTLVSLPWPRRGGAAARQGQVESEARELGKLPHLPGFVPEEFAFRFDFATPRPEAACSGLYLDLGGQGLVATLMAPFTEPASRLRAVVAADLQLPIDWRHFAAGIDPPLTAAVVELRGPLPARGAPWRQFAERLTGRGVRGELPAAVGALAGRAEQRGQGAEGPFYLYHGTVPGAGAVAALQVSAETWLLVLFPQTRAHFAWLPLVLSGLLLALLLTGFELARRRTERAQANALREFREKQNLLDTMQVPLIVTDPNNDRVVYGNRAATTLGLTPGTFFTDRVAALPGAREHYEHRQVAGQEPRRAYGVPLRVRDEAGNEEVRWAIVRSVAVTAPIEALSADERHRLGILFLLEPKADLALLTADLERQARSDERQLLAGLLTHGVDTLAKVLCHGLDPAGRFPLSLELAGFFAAYLERRILATAWLLEHWDAVPPLPPDSTVEAGQARATIDRLQAIFTRARGDAALRSRLHWDNGVLASPTSAGPPLAVTFDWPEEYWFPSPLAGGLGFFLGEVATNAIRHGRPGSRPELSITLDPVRRELLFEVVNELGAGAGAQPPTEKRYGGMRILTRLAGLCEWQGLAFRREAGRFHVSWRIAVSQRGEAGRAD